ncbi:aminotransferase class IV [Parapedobacter sp.]
MSQNYPDSVWLNGRWLPADQATVSVFDRGFLFGDGIYEVIPFYDRRLFMPDAHIERLQRGLTEIGLSFAAADLMGQVVEAAAHAGFPDGTVYIQVTRGKAPRVHRFPAVTEPSVLLYASPFDFNGYDQKMVAVLLSVDFRWQRCNIKSTSLMANVLANNGAHELGMAEHVFERDGTITEGSHSSVFFVLDGCLFTHPNSPHILPGITRDVVISLATQLGIEVKEEGVTVDDLPRVAEAFLTGTTTQLTAIRSFSFGGRNHIVGAGVIGPITGRLQRAFKELTRR